MRVIVMISIVLMGCSSRSDEGRRNHEAISLHNSMVKKANQISHRLNELKSDVSVNRDSIVNLSQALAKWEADLIEVPGNENHSHDHRSHSHSHAPTPDVTEEQMLAIQKELDERLTAIGKRITNLKPESIQPDHDH